MKIRRKEREVTDIAEINAVIESCFSINIGYNDEGHVYIVPVNFGYEEKKGKYTFYFHGATEGRKARLSKKNCIVGFEMDCEGKIKEGKNACDYSTYYSSIIGEGIVSEITDLEEKKYALNTLMKKTVKKGDWNFPSIMLARVGVFKIEVTEISCKAHRQ